MAEGLNDVAEGRVTEWGFEDFLREARVGEAVPKGRDDRNNPRRL
jgi:hypothetical protein